MCFTKIMNNLTYNINLFAKFSEIDIENFKILLNF